MILFLNIVQNLYRLVAPFLVPIALLFASKTKERNKTWAPYRDAEFPVNMRRLPYVFKWMETPDDQLIPSGLYEDTVLSIYKRFGWFVSQWYWLGLRNVGHGIFYPFGFDISDWDTAKIEALKKTKTVGPFEIRFGHKILNDWYGVYGGTMYAMPRFTIRIKK